MTCLGLIMAGPPLAASQVLFRELTWQAQGRRGTGVLQGPQWEFRLFFMLPLTE